MSADEQLLTSIEAARALGVTPATLSKRRRRGDAPPALVAGRTQFYRLADVEAFVGKRSQPKGSETWQIAKEMNTHD